MNYLNYLYVQFVISLKFKLKSILYIEKHFKQTHHIQKKIAFPKNYQFFITIYFPGQQNCKHSIPFDS